MTAPRAVRRLNTIHFGRDEGTGSGSSLLSTDGSSTMTGHDDAECDTAYGGGRPSSGLIARTLALWRPRTDRPLADEDATEMISNMVGFIRILDEWSAAGGQPRGASAGRDMKMAA